MVRAPIRDTPWRFVKFIALAPVFWFVANLTLAFGLGVAQVPDDPKWDWALRLVGAAVSLPACWFAIGAKAEAAERFSLWAVSIFAAATNFLYSIGGLAAFVAFIMVFVKGPDWILKVFYSPSMLLTALTMCMVVPSALFACFFPRARLPGLFALFLSSVMVGFSLWVYCLYATATTNKLTMVFGVLLGGIGVVPVALIAACLAGSWTVAGSIGAGSALVLALRYGSLFLISRAFEKMSIAADADQGREGSGLTEPSEELVDDVGLDRDRVDLGA